MESKESFCHPTRNRRKSATDYIGRVTTVPFAVGQMDSNVIVIIVSLHDKVLNAITERGTINRNGFNANIIPRPGFTAVLFARLVLIKCKFRAVGTRNSVPSVPRTILPPANAYPLSSRYLETYS